MPFRFVVSKAHGIESVTHMIKEGRIERPSFFHYKKRSATLTRQSLGFTMIRCDTVFSIGQRMVLMLQIEPANGRHGVKIPT